jgi:SAM-dependent methyltransferase
MDDFYDRMTPFYHLIFADWEASIERQAGQLDGLIRELWGDQVSTILDVSSGIGTQAIGLAQQGYRVTASDLSEKEIERARHEAQERGLTIDFSVADMRDAFSHHQRQFDLVISADNSVPHLLTDQDILTAFRQFYACVRPGGGCLITVRDYDQVERQGIQVKPYGLRVEDGTRYLVFQVWEFEGDIYDLAMYFIADHGGADCEAHVMRTKYYAVSTSKLIDLMEAAGFIEVKRLDDRFYQPVIVGTKTTFRSLFAL